MNNQYLIIFNFPIMFDTLLELENNLNYKIIKLNFEDLNNFDEKKYQNFIFLTKKKVININNQFIFNQFPLKLNNLVEKLNIEFLKLSYKDKSNYKIGNYTLNSNSKTFFNKYKILKLTEKEISTILYLSKSDNPIGVKELQTKVWDHKSKLETHTVETHIHRLRKKIKEKFNDQNFIISLKSGYKIN